MILHKQIARLVGFATCGSPRGSRNGKKRRRRPGAEWVGSWNLGNWLPGGQRELEANPAGNSER